VPLRLFLERGTTSVGFGDGSRLKTLPDFVPAALQPTISQAAQRWNVSGGEDPRAAWRGGRGSGDAEREAGRL